ncbi:MAG: secretin N-terminal domain-containing protein, partial [Pirellulales bacterium]
MKLPPTASPSRHVPGQIVARLAIVAVLAGCWAPWSANGQTHSNSEQGQQQEPQLNYRGYTLRYKKAEDVRQMLTELLANVSTDTHLVIDRKTNQLIVHGPAHIHAIVKRLVDEVDRPSSVPTAAVEEPVLKTYACRPSRLAATADRLRAAYRDDRHVSVATHASTGQLLILAPPSRQVEISAWMARAAVEPANRTDRGQPGAGDQKRSYFLPLKQTSVMRIERVLNDAFGSRFRRAGKILPEQVAYQLTGAN